MTDEHECKHEYDFGVMATQIDALLKNQSEIKDFLLKNGLLTHVAGLRSSIRWVHAFIVGILAVLAGVAFGK